MCKKLFGKLPYIDFTGVDGELIRWTVPEKLPSIDFSGVHLGDTTTWVGPPRFTRHGKRYSRAYKAWLHMKDRCLNPRNKNFARYGGRGITICQPWIDSFIAFYQDMGDPPPAHSLDRIDNDGPYCRENCRWATRKTQMNNMSTNHPITANGETHTLAEWSHMTGLDRFIIADRLSRDWTPEQALTQSVRLCSTEPIVFDGKSQSLSAWARELGMSISLLQARLQTWSLQDALTTPVGGRWPSITFDGKTQNISEWSRETGLTRATIRRRLKLGLTVAEVLRKG